FAPRKDALSRSESRQSDPTTQDRHIAVRRGLLYDGLRSRVKHLTQRANSLRGEFLMRLTMLVLLACLSAETAFGDDAAGIFERRILPIARSQQSSCTECHFSGVELKQYILDDASQTFAALRDAGLINVERPADSKLLTFISRKPAKEDALLAKVRSEEFAAFKSWIEAAVKDPAVLKAAAPAKPIGSNVPVEVIRHARHDRVLQAFTETIWAEIDRCIGCHSPEKNQKQMKEFGNRVSWISPNDPAGTLA